MSGSHVSPIASVVGLFLLGAFLPVAPDTARLNAAPIDLTELRALEEAVVETVRRTSPAFCFIEGGSGFLISEDGLVLTNEHVVVGKTEVDVYMTGAKHFRAEVVGHDPGGDVALLKLEKPPGVEPLELGDSDAVRVGEPVIALGDPFLIASANLFLNVAPPNFEPSVSFGRVSALHRYSELYFDAIQVDVAVNRGNSGGPLLSLDGKVLGINGKIETKLLIGINTGVGYAIPINQIKRFIGPLSRARGGNVQHGEIRGLRVAERTGDGMGLPIIEAEELAAKLGFARNDRILSIDGLAVPTRTRFLGIVGTYPAGSEIAVTLRRGEEIQTISVPLVEGGRARLGIDIGAVEAPATGVLVKKVHPGSAAERAEIEVGDIIVGYNEQPVESGLQIKKYLDASFSGDVIQLSILRDGEQLEVDVRLGGTGSSFQ